MMPLQYFVTFSLIILFDWNSVILKSISLIYNHSSLDLFHFTFFVEHVVTEDIV